MGNQVLGVPQMHLSMDAEQLRQLGYDPETIQVKMLDTVESRHSSAALDADDLSLISPVLLKPRKGGCESCQGESTTG